jgi:hypothetical protein
MIKARQEKRRTQEEHAEKLIHVAGRHGRGLRIARELKDVPQTSIRYQRKPTEARVELTSDGPLVIKTEPNYVPR